MLDYIMGYYRFLYMSNIKNNTTEGETMREFEKNISVNVIATFEIDKDNEQQDIFDIKHIWKIALKDKKHLVNYIKRQLDPNRKLVKLSLCWSCSKHMVNKYPCIKESIFKDNGKYLFGSWA